MAGVGNFLERVNSFASLKQGEQIRLLGYYLHTWEHRLRFAASDIKSLYTAARHLAPSNVSAVLANEVKAKRLLNDKDGYYLTASSERALAADYPEIEEIRSASLKASQSLRDLVPKVTSPEGATYLAEAVTCFEAGCHRAAIVMSWAVCYDHLMGYVLNHAAHLSACNQSLATRNMRVRAITKREDFAELKESEVLDLCRISGITPKTLSKALRQCLDIRNDYAHPSGQCVSPSKAESFIEDVVNNVILKLK